MENFVLQEAEEELELLVAVLDGAGTAGTSYSGGTGGGNESTANAALADGIAFGGKGGRGRGTNGGNGGVGNPGGDGYCASAKGTGGLLFSYCGLLNGEGSFNVEGTTNFPGWDTTGGSSGGGSLNIFTNSTKDDLKYLNFTCSGGLASLGTSHNAAGARQYGGAGGSGTANIGTVVNGYYVDFNL